MDVHLGGGGLKIRKIAIFSEHSRVEKKFFRPHILEFGPLSNDTGLRSQLPKKLQGKGGEGGGGGGVRGVGSVLHPLDLKWEVRLR